MIIFWCIFSMVGMHHILFDILSNFLLLNTGSFFTTLSMIAFLLLFLAYSSSIMSVFHCILQNVQHNHLIWLTWIIASTISLYLYILIILIIYNFVAYCLIFYLIIFCWTICIFVFMIVNIIIWFIVLLSVSWHHGSYVCFKFVE